SHALAEIVTLARRHAIPAVEIAAAIGDAPSSTAAAAENRWRGVRVSVLGFLGGTFVFAGVGVFIALQWDSMNSAARIVVTLGSGISAFVLALVAVQDVRYTKATTPLFLVAAGLEPTGMLVGFNELGSGGDWRYAS